MMHWAATAMDLLWRNALAAVPLVLVVAAICRWVPCRPTTRHALWAMVLIWLIIPPLVPGLAIPQDTPVSPESRDVAAAALPEGNVGVRADAERWADADSRAPARANPRVQPPGRVRRSEPVETLASNPSCPITEGSPPGRDSSRMVAPARPRSQETLVPSSRSRGLPSRVARRSDPPGRALPRPPTARSAGVVKRHPLSWFLTRIERAAGAVSRVAQRQRATAVRSERLAHAPVRKALQADSSQLMYFDGATRSGGAAQTEFSEIHPIRAKRPEPAHARAPVDADIRQSASPVAAPPEASPIPAWVAGLAAVRDAFVALPRLPSPIWFGGIALVLWVYIFRAVGFRRRLRHAYDAPAPVQRLVADTARRLGLRRLPQAMMTDDGVGPMIWCGRRARLLLPRGLWSQLDGVGRKAILCHELAHLRRRDHWICRGELVVAALYWWHPLVWWVRRRLHEEAEFCCDAWVTWLMPGERRAYAEALLHTKNYLSLQTHAAPVAGIGILTGRASRLARRITMVMTGSVRPRLSVPGIALVAAMAVTGWLASPAQSCPSGKGEAKTASAGSTDCTTKAVQIADKHKQAVTTYEQYLTQRDKGGAVYVTKPAHETAYETYVLASGQPEAHGSSHAEPTDMRDLEKRIERLEKLIEERLMAMDRGTVTRRERTESRTVRRPRVPTQASPVAPVPPVPPVPPARMEPKPGPAPSGWAVAPKIDDDCEKVTVGYRLPEGQLEGVTQLMVRPDVPILVRPGGDAIEVIGTKSQQAIFRAFVEMIGGDKEVKKHAYRLSPGKLDALTELMSRSDVPVLISREDDQIIVHGTDAEQAVFRNFVEMIDGKSGSTAGAFFGGVGASAEALKRAEITDMRAEERAAAAEARAARRAEEAGIRAEQRALEAEFRAQERAVKVEKRAKQRLEHAKQEEIERRLKKSGAGIKGGCSTGAIHREDLTALLEHASGVLSEQDAKALASKLVALSDHEQLAGWIEGAEGRTVEVEHAKQWLASRAKQIEANARNLALQAAAAERQADAVRAQVEALEAQAERAEAATIDLTTDDAFERSDGEAEDAAAQAALHAAQVKQLDAQAAALEVEADQMDVKASQLEYKAQALAELVSLIANAVDGVEAYLVDASGS